MNQAFEDWWKVDYGMFNQEAHNVIMTKRAAELAWNAAIEHVRTTEPMPVNERVLAALLRIETLMARLSLQGIPIDRIVRATANGWTDIKEISGVWVGDEPGSVRHKEIPE